MKSKSLSKSSLKKSNIQKNEKNQNSLTTRSINNQNSNSILLSKILDNFPQFFDENKISVVQKCVNKIDLLPKNYQDIEILYLSNNNLSNLSGLEQFKNIKTLTLAHNEIDDLDHLLKFLSLYSNLEVLNLTGNPICSQHNYRNILVSSFSKLKILDGKQVTQEERNESEVKLRKEAGLLHLMLSNYCELIKLNSFNKKMDIHKSLLIANNRFIPSEIDINIEKFINMYKYEDYLDEEIKNGLKNNLIRDINTLNKELNPTNEEENIDLAYSELILRQQQKLAELKTKIEQKIISFSQLIERRKTNFLESKMKKKELMKSEILKTERFNISALSRSTTKNKNAKKVSIIKDDTKSLKIFQSSPIEKDLCQKLNQTNYNSNDYFSIYSTPESKEKEKTKIVNMNSNSKTNIIEYRQIYKKPESKSVSPYKEIPQPSTMEINPKKSTHFDECCRHLHRSKIVSPESSGKKINNNRKNKEKEMENIINTLKKTLEDKNFNLKKLEENNKILNEKLINFEKNNINVKNEVKNINENLEKSAERQSKLDYELVSAKKQMYELMNKNLVLEKENKEYLNSIRKVDEYAKIVQNIYKEQNNLDISEKYDKKRLQKLLFNKLLDSVIFSRKVKNWKEKKEIRIYFLTIKKIFYFLHINYDKNTLIKKKNNKRKNIIKRKILNKWKKYLNLIKHLSILKEKKSDYLKSKCFLGFKRFLNYKNRAHIVKKKIDNLRKLVLIKKTIFGLKLHLKNSKMNYQEEKKLNKIAFNFDRNKKFKFFFTAWKTWLKKIRIPKLNCNYQLKRFYNLNLIKMGISLLIKNYEVGKNLNNKANRISRKNSLKLLMNCFRFWKIDFFVIKSNKDKLKLKQKFYFMRKVLRKWGKKLLEKRKNEKNLLKSELIYKILLMRRFFHKIQKYKNIKKKNRIFSKAILVKNLQTKKKQIIFFWNSMYHKLNEKKQKLNEEKLKMLNIYFKKIHTYYARKKFKKLHLLALERYIIIKERKKIDKIFYNWLKIHKKNVRKILVTSNFQKRRNLKLIRSVFIELLRNSKKSLYENLQKAITKTNLIEANFKQQLEYMDMIDEEKSEYFQKVTFLTNEINSYKEDINSKNLEMNHYKKIIQNLENDDKKIREREKELIREIEEKELKIKQISMDFETNICIKDKQYEILSNENNKLMRNIRNLNDDINFKKSTLLDNEKNLIEKNNVTERIAKENELKLKNSIKMASEFKSIIEKNKIEIDEYKIKLKKLEENNYEMRISIQEKNDLIKEANSNYENKIKEYEKIISLLKDENNFYKEDHERLIRQINDLKSELRKYEFEIENLTDQKHQETTNFINNLPRKNAENSFALRKEKNSIKISGENNEELELSNLHNNIKKLQDNLEKAISDNFEYEGSNIKKSEYLRSKKSFNEDDIMNNTSFFRNSNQQSVVLNRNELMKFTPISRKYDSQIYSPETDNKAINLEISDITPKPNQIKNLISIDDNPSSLRNIIRENIEKRIKVLNDNLENDIFRAKSKLQN